MHDGFGGLASRMLEVIREEAPKACVMAYALVPPVAPEGVSATPHQDALRCMPGARMKKKNEKKGKKEREREE